jgi:hypothetical protein
MGWTYSLHKTKQTPNTTLMKKHLGKQSLYIKSNVSEYYYNVVYENRYSGLDLAR